MTYYLHNNGVIREGETCPGEGSYCKPQPVAVIPFEDREQVERLVQLFDDAVAPSLPASVSDEDLRDMQAALREFADPRPPKPDEPTGHLAVVEDSRGVRWVNWCDPRDNPASHERRWQSAEMDTDEWRDYVDIDAVEVLSEGVTP